MHRKINELNTSNSEYSQYAIKIKSLADENNSLQGKLREFGSKMQLIIDENSSLQNKLRELLSHNSEISVWQNKYNVLITEKMRLYTNKLLN